MASSPTYPTATGPVTIAKKIADSDGTNIIDIVDNSAGSSAVKIESLAITTTNTADRTALLYLYDGSASFLAGSRTVTQLAGTNGSTTPRVNVLAALGTAGPDGVACIWVGAGKKLQAAVDASLASGKVMYFTGRYITYT
jgi:hypothetical protein